MTIDSLPRLAGIYLITCTANGKTYVGSSQNIRKRVCAHRNQLRRNEHANIHLQRAWNLHSEASFEVKVLELCVKSRLLECETYWFEKHNVGDDRCSFNLSRKPGAPMSGMKHSEEALAKMSASQTGRKHTEETRSKISVASKGKPKSDEHKAKLRANRLGLKASPETRLKLSAIHSNPSAELRYKMGSSMRGKKHSSEVMDKIFKSRAEWFVVTSPNGEEILIQGLAKFCRENNLDQGTMSRVMRSGRTHKGWKCRRA